MPDDQIVVAGQGDASAALVQELETALGCVRDDLSDNPYIKEAIKVLAVGGYRSAIGNIWNAVVDDLRMKIVHRSLSLFNKASGVGRDVKEYEDFQNFVSDDQLIDGAYKIGVIGWEASKVLRQAKQTRHIFDGHPRSSDPSLIKVLAMFEDCVRYVLREPYPTPVVDIDDYITMMGSADFDRNEMAVANALTELPEVYKNELINRLLTVYVHPDTSSTLRSNVEFVSPILWPVLPKETKVAVVRRVDTQIAQGSASQTTRAFAFVNMVGANAYLSPTAKDYQIRPLVEKLKDGLDQWSEENEAVRALRPYAANIPPTLLEDYVMALTHTYVGYMGSSIQFSRKDFYANEASAYIPQMFEAFDDSAAAAFVEVVKRSGILRDRIEAPAKLARLRSLANIVLGRISGTFADKDFLETLADEERTGDFLKLLPQLKRRKA